MKNVDGKKCLKHYNGIIKILPKKNLVYHNGQDILMGGLRLREKLKNVSYFALIVMSLFILNAEIMAEGKKHFRFENEWPIILKVAHEYKLNSYEKVILLAIRECEAGESGFQFGVKAAKGSDLETQAQWAAGSIKANIKRYNELMITGVYKGSRRMIEIESEGHTDEGSAYVSPKLDFIEFMGSYGSPTGFGWAPVDSPEMGEKERKLNKNWIPNMHKIVEDLNKHFKEKGMDNAKP